MSWMKWSGFALLLGAYALLYPGLTEPMLSVAGTVERSDLVEIGRQIVQSSPDVPGLLRGLIDNLVDHLDTRGTIPAFDKTNSILGTATDLYRNGHLPVALLIVVFSVLVPLLKALLLLAAQLPLARGVRSTLLRVAAATSKWSMADVFVIAIFITYLAAGGLQQNGALVDFRAELGQGFWYFLGYCLVSIAGTQLSCTAALRELSAAQRTKLNVERDQPDQPAGLPARTRQA